MLLFLLEIFIAVLAPCAGIVLEPSTYINFESFRVQVAEIIGNVHTKNSSVCTFPHRAIMFTYADKHMIDLVILQRKAMDVNGIRACLESRFVTVCIDSESFHACESREVPHCLKLIIPLQSGRPAFGNLAYNYLTMLKHKLVLEALAVATEVFYFDADCLLFRNPWDRAHFEPRLSYSLPTATTSDGPPFELMYQRDRGRHPECRSGTVNTGQIFVRNSSKTQQYLRNMLSHETIVLKGKAGLDQDFVAYAADNASVSRCALPTDLFTGLCPSSRHPEAVIGSIVSFHVSCTASLTKKKNEMFRFINTVRRFPSKTMGKIVF